MQAKRLNASHPGHWRPPIGLQRQAFAWGEATKTNLPEGCSKTELALWAYT
jgi:hypothetical protein